MLITSGETITVQLEPVQTYDFHEKPVVLQALGSLVVAYRCHRETAEEAADLGCRFATLKHTDEDGAKITTQEFALNDNEVQLLSRALLDLIEATENDVRACAQSGNLHGCSVRYVESMIANELLEKLTAESNTLPPKTDLRFRPGFAPPNA